MIPVYRQRIPVFYYLNQGEAPLGNIRYPNVNMSRPPLRAGAVTLLAVVRPSAISLLSFVLFLALSCSMA